jgi:hypothetical protein
MGSSDPRRSVWPSACSLVLLPLLSCGDSPPGPSTVNASGTWKGTTTLSSAVPSSHCVAGLWRAAFSAAQPATLTVSSQGTTVNVKSSNNLTGLTCDYTGQISPSGGITATLDRCSIPAVVGVACADGMLRGIRFAGGSLAVQVSANQMTGTESGNYEVFLSPSGGPDGSVTVNAAIRVTR